MSELKPCPFCGGEAELCYSEVDTFCRKCNVMQETEMWNTRPIEDALQARAEKAETMVERLIEARGNAYMFLQLMNEWDDYVAERKECEKNGN